MIRYTDSHRSPIFAHRTHRPERACMLENVSEPSDQFGVRPTSARSDAEIDHCGHSPSCFARVSVRRDLVRILGHPDCLPQHQPTLCFRIEREEERQSRIFPICPYQQCDEDSPNGVHELSPSGEYRRAMGADRYRHSPATRASDSGSSRRSFPPLSKCQIRRALACGSSKS